MRSAQGALRQTLLPLQRMQDIANLVLDLTILIDTRLQLLKDRRGDESGVSHFAVKGWYSCCGGSGGCDCHGGPGGDGGAKRSSGWVLGCQIVKLLVGVERGEMARTPEDTYQAKHFKY